MNPNALDILIVGAGIAGLTAARALLRQGHRPKLVEQAETWVAAGAGIMLQPNSTGVLNGLGIQLEPDDIFVPPGVQLASERGRELAGRVLPPNGANAPFWSIHRADLQASLLRAIAPLTPILGTRVTAVRPDADGVEVETASGDLTRYDLVIGADGIGSATRASLLGPIETRESRQCCTRFVVDTPEIDLEQTVERWAPGLRTGLVPLSRGRIYVYLVADAASSEPIMPRDAPFTALGACRSSRMDTKCQVTC